MKNKLLSVEAGKLLMRSEVLGTFTKAGAPEADVAVAKVGKAEPKALEEVGTIRKWDGRHREQSVLPSSLYRFEPVRYVSSIHMQLEIIPIS